MGTRLILVDEIQSRTSCAESWDDMPGDDRVRSCARCSRSVYNLSGMASGEAIALIAGREGPICARMFLRPDGTVVTADCTPAKVPASAGRRLRRVHALAIVLAALVLVWMGRTGGQSRPSGPGVTWNDWVHWASVTLGLRATPPPTPVFTTYMGDVF